MHLNPRSVFVSFFYYSTSMFSKRPFQNLDVLVNSHGGVGTTFFIEFVAKHKRTNKAAGDDFIKHLPLPPKRVSSSLRMVYIFGDPVNATISLARRSYLNLQMRKNGNWKWPFIYDNLTDYIECGKDGLFLTNMLKNWSNRTSFNCPALLVRYETLWKNLDEIFEFLDIDEIYKITFPVNTPRSSDDELLDKNSVGRLRKIYAEYYRILDEIGETRRIC